MNHFLRMSFIDIYGFMKIVICGWKYECLMLFSNSLLNKALKGGIDWVNMVRKRQHKKIPMLKAIGICMICKRRLRISSQRYSQGD